MSMTQRYAGMLRRQAADWDKREMPIQAECCRQAARHMEQRENELEHALIVARETLEKECDDGDALLRMLDLDPEQYRTEGGRLNLLRVRAVLADRKTPNVNYTTHVVEEPAIEAATATQTTDSSEPQEEA